MVYLLGSLPMNRNNNGILLNCFSFKGTNVRTIISSNPMSGKSINRLSLWMFRCSVLAMDFLPLPPSPKKTSWVVEFLGSLYTSPDWMSAQGSSLIPVKASFVYTTLGCVGWVPSEVSRCWPRSGLLFSATWSEKHLSIITLHIFDSFSSHLRRFLNIRL